MSGLLEEVTEVGDAVCPVLLELFAREETGLNTDEL